MQQMYWKTPVLVQESLRPWAVQWRKPLPKAPPTAPPTAPLKPTKNLCVLLKGMLLLREFKVKIAPSSDFSSAVRVISFNERETCAGKMAMVFSTAPPVVLLVVLLVALLALQPLP
jgi:hypothetical protein